MAKPTRQNWIDAGIAAARAGDFSSLIGRLRARAVLTTDEIDIIIAKLEDKPSRQWLAEHLAIEQARIVADVEDLMSGRDPEYPGPINQEQAAVIIRKWRGHSRATVFRAIKALSNKRRRRKKTVSRKS